MNKLPRFIYHHDGAFLQWAQPPISIREFQRETLGRVAGTTVDTISCHMFSFGSAVPLYPSTIEAARPVYPEKAETINVWKGIRNLQAMVESGEDYWAPVVDATHERGMRFWAAMRFNDGHPGSHGLRDQFVTDHPEYRIGQRCSMPADMHHVEMGELVDCNHLDYSEPAVRRHRLDLIEEVCDRYDVDGFEMDFNREGGHSFPKGKVADGAAVLTEYIAAVRKVLRQIGDRRGRAIPFAVRCPGTPHACHEWDFDIERWIREGLVDAVTPTVMYDTTCELPFDDFVKMAKGTPCRIYASVTEGVGPGLYQSPPVEALRAAVLVAWQLGVDGINLYNFNHQIVCDQEQYLQSLGELGDPETLQRRNKLYMVAGVGLSYQGYYYGMNRYSAQRRQLPRKVPVGGSGVTVNFPVADDLVASRGARVLESVTLLLDLLYLTGAECFELTINGMEIRFTDAHFAPSDQHALNWNAQHGHFTARFDLTRSECLRLGANELRLALSDRPRDIVRSVIFYAMRLDVRYHLLPMGTTG